MTKLYKSNNTAVFRNLRYCSSDKNYELLPTRGPDGEIGASLRYLNQRYAMPYDKVKGILTDVGTEELAHVEMVSAILYQLTKNLSPEEIKASGFDTYFVDHTTGIYPVSAAGVPFTAAYFQSKGDIITDLTEDLAAEGTIAKEQPTFRTPEKALFYAGFRTFAPHTQNRRLRPHKNNKLQKYGMTSCFQGKMNTSLLIVTIGREVFNNAFKLYYKSKLS